MKPSLYLPSPSGVEVPGEPGSGTDPSDARAYTSNTRSSEPTATLPNASRAVISKYTSSPATALDPSDP